MLNVTIVSNYDVTESELHGTKVNSDLLVQSFYGKKSVNLQLIATEGFSTVLDSAMYP